MKSDTEELSMSVAKEHLLTFRTASAAFSKSVQDVCQDGVELFISNKLPITDESRNRYKGAIYTVRLNRQLVSRLKQESEKRDVPVSVMFRAWAIELDRKFKIEISYKQIDFKEFVPKNLAEHQEIQAVEVVKGKKFAALVQIPIKPPFQEGDKYAKGRKVIRVDVDKQGKYWIIYIVNG
jgi:hypothetical protein